MSIVPFKVSKLEAFISSNEIDEAQDYVHQYIFKVFDGVYFYDVRNTNEPLTFLTWEQLKNTYLPNTMSNKKVSPRGEDVFFVFKWFQKENYRIYRPISSYQTPMIDKEQETINLMPQPLFVQDSVKEFTEYPENLKQGVERILKHMKLVWCNNSDTSFAYITQWFAGIICNGKKQQTALFLKTREGSGKGIVVDFLMNKVLGSRLGLSTNNTESLGKYNKCLAGKLLVNYNEFPCSTIGEWKRMNDVLKQYITDPTFSLREMYRNQVEISNKMNILITSNHDSVRITYDDRRYVVLDTNDSKKGNVKYFTQLRNTMNTPGMGEAFYAYLVQEYSPEFNSVQRPETESRNIQIAENVPIVLRFIKDEILPSGKGLHMSVKQFKESLKCYAKVAKITDAKIKTELTMIGVEWIRKKVDGKKTCMYSVDQDSLFKQMVSKKFIHKEEQVYLDYEHNGDVNEDTRTEVQKLRETIKQLKERIDELELEREEPVEEPVEDIVEEQIEEPVENTLVEKVDIPAEKEVVEEKVEEPKKPNIKSFLKGVQAIKQLSNRQVKTGSTA